MYALATMSLSNDIARPEHRKQSVKKPDMPPTGTKAFQYNEGIIYAINQKNADRKAKNKGWTKMQTK